MSKAELFLYSELFFISMKNKEDKESFFPSEPEGVETQDAGGGRVLGGKEGVGKWEGPFASLPGEASSTSGKME